MRVAPDRGLTDGPHTRAVGARTGAFFTDHGRMVFAVCRAILHDADEAADATQATFLSAHEALLSGTAIRDPGAWLATIARNECRARLRVRASEPLPLHDECIRSSLMTEDDVERRTTVECLRIAIASLPEKQREAVVLRDLYGLHYGEIGRALGVSRPSVEALLFRARRTLRIGLRPVAGGALAVPLAVREGLAQAIPFFATGPSGAAGIAGAGVGLAAKLTWPVAAKVAAGVVAAGVAGTALGTQSLTVVPIREPALPATEARQAPELAAAYEATEHPNVLSRASSVVRATAPGLTLPARREPLRAPVAEQREVGGTTRALRTPGATGEPAREPEPASEPEGTPSTRVQSSPRVARVPAPGGDSRVVATIAPASAELPRAPAVDEVLSPVQGEPTEPEQVTRLEPPTTASGRTR